MFRSEKYLLLLTKAQRIETNNQLGAQRFAYNQLVDQNKYNTDKFCRSVKGRYVFIQIVRKLTPWMKNIGTQYLAYTQKNFNAALNRAFETGHFPKKKKPGNESITASQNIEVTAEYIKMPMIGKIKYKTHKSKYFGNKIQKITIKKEQGKYYAIIFYELPDVSKVPIINVTGVDCGIHEIAVTSDDNRYDVYFDLRIQQGIKDTQRKLAKKEEARKKSKTKKRSKKYLKQLRCLQARSRKQANRRKNHLHQISKEIVQSSDAVIVENLAIAEMMQKSPHMAKKIANAAIGIFINQLEYKCEDYGKTFIKIDRYYPSSKTCSSCGGIKSAMPLSQRILVCDTCGHKQDRDFNAARNIRREGCSRIPGYQMPENYALKTQNTSSSDIKLGIITEGNPEDVVVNDETNT